MVKVIRTMIGLQGKHTISENAWIDMKGQKNWDAYDVNTQTFKTTIEAACMLLRVDGIVSRIALPSFLSFSMLGNKKL